MTKFDTKIRLFTTCFFVFFAEAKKMSVLTETLREHVEYRDIHANIFFYFFNILILVFQIKEAYVCGIKSAFPCV
jgi:hypothetical protein